MVEEPRQFNGQQFQQKSIYADGSWIILVGLMVLLALGTATILSSLPADDPLRPAEAIELTPETAPPVQTSELHR